MGGYIVNFAVYTLAMLGLIFFALMIYQKVAQNGALGLKKSNFLEIEETMPMGPRKNLYVVRAGEERFLIASDIDKTSCIAKLADSKTEVLENEQNEVSRSLDELYGIETPAAPKKPALHRKNVQSVDELPVIVDFSEKKNNNKKVIRNMLNKING